MSAFVEVFKRKEKKYRLSADQFSCVLKSLDGRMELDGFGKTTVSSLYLDTPNREIIERSLDKPLYKEKLRLRKYVASSNRAASGCSPDSAGSAAMSERAASGCNPDSAGSAAMSERGSLGEDCVFVELKKKYKGIVYKRRVSMSSRAAKMFLSGASYEDACARFPIGDAKLGFESNSHRSVQIGREISAFVSRYDHLSPSMVIACERSAYSPIVLDVPHDVASSGDGSKAAVPNAPFSNAAVPNAPFSSASFSNASISNGLTSNDLRITFDENIRYRDCFSSLKKGEWDGYLLQPGEALMEIKAIGPYPKWLASALADCGAFPSSFSKYGSAYSRCASTCARTAG